MPNNIGNFSIKPIAPQVSDQYNRGNVIASVNASIRRHSDAKRHSSKTLVSIGGHAKSAGG